MRKIPKEKDNPIDNWMLNACEKIVPFLKRIGHTPNILTTYSFFFGILSLFFLYHRKITLFAISLLISYFFDCMDGYMARLYNMETVFGDLYDHFTDIFVIVGIVIVCIINYQNAMSYQIIIVFIILTVLMQIHFGCQQKIYGSDNPNETLDNLQNLCKNEEWITVTRFFGGGSFIIFVILIVIYLEKTISLTALI